MKNKPGWYGTSYFDEIRIKDIPEYNNVKDDDMDLINRQFKFIFADFPPILKAFLNPRSTQLKAIEIIYYKDCIGTTDNVLHTILVVDEFEIEKIRRELERI